MAEEQVKQTEQEAQTETEQKALTQDQVDRIVKDRVARERQKYSDYEDLVKFKTEHQKAMEERTQKELEAQKEYEKLKEGWSSKEKQYQDTLTQKEQSIKSMQIGYALTAEIMSQGAYPEAVDLLKSRAVLDADGNVRIKGKDANGIDTELPVGDGVKQFLEEKPYLVKAQTRSGAGTGAAQHPGQAQGQRNLGAELQEAMSAGDRKKVNELKTMIRAKQGGFSNVVY